ncbi:MAG TPA: hypothetical protein VEU09_08220 [Candidatus Binatia bacterium]|nr:hypothetical protein [Candidatus Binatia bacterium]
MPRRTRLYYAFLGVVMLSTVAAPLMRELSQRRDIWWTPSALMVPLAEGKDRVVIYARGKPLLDLVQVGAVRLEEHGTTTTLTAGELGLRFNNWDRVRAARLPLMLMYAAGCGVSAFLILLGLTGRLTYRPEKGPPATGPQSLR